jgi:hypothetical protein
MKDYGPRGLALTSKAEMPDRILEGDDWPAAPVYSEAMMAEEENWVERQKRRPLWSRFFGGK